MVDVLIIDRCVNTQFDASFILHKFRFNIVSRDLSNTKQLHSTMFMIFCFEMEIQYNESIHTLKNKANRGKI